MECATPLAAACPNCGAANLPAAKFCSECATPLSAARTAAATPARRARHRPRREPRPREPSPSAGSSPSCSPTSSASRRSPRSATPRTCARLLTRYFDLARDVIERYGGTVEKFIGDAVMAVWGAPIAHEDDAERAVRAALDLVDAVRGLGPGIEARAGVLTGEAAVTLGATNQGMVAGDLVNTASRLQSRRAAGDRARRRGDAARGGRRRSPSSPPATRCSRARSARCRPGGRCASSPSAAAVGRIGDARGAVRRPRRGAAPAQGPVPRHRPRGARRGSSPSSGPAGIGKSRLAWEFLKYIDGLVEDV